MSEPFSGGHFPPRKYPGESEIHPEDVRNPEVNYDRTDLSAKAIAGFLIALALLGVFMHLTLWSVYKYLAGPELASHPLAGYIQTSTQQLPQGDPQRVIPPPRLQPDPPADLNKFRTSEEEVLNSYDWVNQQNGIARIPVEQAINTVATQGLPVRQTPPESAAIEQSQAPAAGSGGALTMQQAGETSGQTQAPESRNP